MPELRIEYFAHLNQSLGEKGVEYVRLTGPVRLSELIRDLAKKHGGRFSEMVFDKQGAVRSTILCFVDGRFASLTDELEPGRAESLLLMTPMAGG